MTRAWGGERGKENGKETIIGNVFRGEGYHF